MHARNPLQVVLHQQVGIDSFALDGDETSIYDSWQDRPDLFHSPRS